jgi:hypothetical protein
MQKEASGETPDAATGAVALPKKRNASSNVMSKSNPERFRGG